jgi:hypothetical protein
MITSAPKLNSGARPGDVVAARFLLLRPPWYSWSGDRVPHDQFGRKLVECRAGVFEFDRVGGCQKKRGDTIVVERVNRFCFFIVKAIKDRSSMIRSPIRRVLDRKSELLRTDL